jgi:hypothetical protein
MNDSLWEDITYVAHDTEPVTEPGHGRKVFALDERRGGSFGGSVLITRTLPVQLCPQARIKPLEVPGFTDSADDYASPGTNQIETGDGRPS